MSLLIVVSLPDIKTTVSALLTIALLGSAVLHGEDSENIRVIPTEPQSGVFVTYGWQSTLIELKDGKFRYWFSSDVKTDNEPAYPLSGNYTVEGSKITLKHPQISQNDWNFRKVEGVVTLWRPEALKMNQAGTFLADHFPGGFEVFKKRGTGLVLVPSEKSAEDAWTQKGFGSVTFEVLASVLDVQPPDDHPSGQVELMMMAHDPTNLKGMKFSIVTRIDDWSKARKKYPVGTTYRISFPGTFKDAATKWRTHNLSVARQIESGATPASISEAFVTPKVNFLNLVSPPAKFDYYPPN